MEQYTRLPDERDMRQYPRRLLNSTNHQKYPKRVPNETSIIPVDHRIQFSYRTHRFFSATGMSTRSTQCPNPLTHEDILAEIGIAAIQSRSQSRVHAGRRQELGAWVDYGLGSANENLPSFVVLCDNNGRPVNGPRNWGSGFIPATHRGVRITGGDEPITISICRRFILSHVSRKSWPC